MSGLEKKFRERNRRSADAIDITQHDNNAKCLIGWPGYRTARNKSGLGYIETQAEWAHMQGVMIRWMMTGKFKTRNPIYLFLITVTGLSHISPVFLLFSTEGQTVLLRNLSVLLPYILIGMLLLANVFLSLVKCKKGESITG